MKCEGYLAKWETARENPHKWKKKSNIFMEIMSGFTELMSGVCEQEWLRKWINLLRDFFCEHNIKWVLKSNN